MALHPDFPRSPYVTLSPDVRWFPAAEELRSTAYEKLLPPLVAKVREEVKAGVTRLCGRIATLAGASDMVVRDGSLIEQADGTQSPIPILFRAARSGRDGDLAL